MHSSGSLPKSVNSVARHSNYTGFRHTLSSFRYHKSRYSRMADTHTLILAIMADVSPISFIRQIPASTATSDLSSPVDLLSSSSAHQTTDRFAISVDLRLPLAHNESSSPLPPLRARLALVHLIPTSPTPSQPSALPPTPPFSHSTPQLPPFTPPSTPSSPPSEHCETRFPSSNPPPNHSPTKSNKSNPNAKKPHLSSTNLQN